MVTKLKHKTLSGALLDEIRQAILSGQYASGSQLRQDALAEAYGVSRIPVREVLLQLEAEGLVKILPQRGAVVSEISREDIDDVFDLRMILEPRLLLASAPLLDEADLSALDVRQDNYVKAIATGQRDNYGRLNAELHMAIYHRATMPKSQQIVASLLQTSDRYTRLQLSSQAAMEKAMSEHAEMIRLIKARRSDEAAELLKLHIGSVRTDLLKVLNGS
ncbi:GntR family transcriptional regulator (plasmid) [Neorhizobium sp. SOG26]|uniref:GntR family transcriptional regulator n=1 Tax=Neorhizobium turbinariae TaxID=2937795 RepID=A0ABT0IN06_9HYPH|nr:MULTISPECIES: GntR family transcriptional regulator [Neorhizobium]AXV17924.1 GntR family transcriptional regulator [Neorhizobium sp. SOG26]MCK8779255.1 GntR family transcriptional regulator [Neorhizobium turbinariae]